MRQVALAQPEKPQVPKGHEPEVISGSSNENDDSDRTLTVYPNESRVRPDDFPPPLMEDLEPDGDDMDLVPTQDYLFKQMIKMGRIFPMILL